MCFALRASSWREHDTGAGQRHWLGSATLRRPALYPEGITSNGMGPRLLYVLIVGAVIVGCACACASGTRARSRGCGRSCSTPISGSTRARSIRALPVRIIDIDEESLKRIGQWPWPRTVLAELVDKLVGGGAAAIGFDMVFPEPDRMSPANTLRYWPQSDALASLRERGREAAPQRPGLRRGDRQGPRRARLHRSRRKPPRCPRPRRASPMAATTPSCSLRITPGAAASLTELQDKAQGAARSTGFPKRIRSSAACPCWSASATSSIPLCRPRCSGSRKARRPIS